MAASAEDGADAYLDVAEHPHVAWAHNEWHQRWRAWAELEQVDRPARELYASLFSTYVTATSHTEELELVLGVGLLAWTLRLEEVLPATADSPAAAAVDGRRAAPPEDSGGGTDLASITLVVDDPDRFDLDELNQALRTPCLVLREHGLGPRLVDLVNRLRYTRVGDDLAQRVVGLALTRTELDDDELVVALAACRWFLDRAKGGGIELTSAGYLKPADVQAASAVVPAMGDWIGKNNRESLAAPAGVPRVAAVDGTAAQVQGPCSSPGQTPPPSATR